MYHTVFKRLFDLIFSTLVLLAISPILLVAMLWIKLDTPGPVFFLQERLGLNGNIFKVIKFRTMTHKPREVHHQVFQNDPEVTRSGSFLRKTKIDELPQFINVVFGDMSVVGPRPCLPVVRSKYRSVDSEKRFTVKPGVTSLAGVKGSIYLTWVEKFYYDRIYAENIKFTNDLKIIFKTVLVVFLGEKRFLEKPKLD
ncbi:MAG: sugar transferase [Proteobacteria bacterium]|nr:sugar transferase [Pseudomonadota bacterium]